MVDGGAYKDKRVSDWIWPGEQPHDKSFFAEDSSTDSIFHGAEVLDILLDPRRGAGSARAVVVRPPPARGMETLLDTINLVGAFVMSNKLEGTVLINFSWGWRFYAGSDPKWTSVLRDRYEMLVRGLGVIPVVAAGNSRLYPFQFSDMPTVYHDNDVPGITVSE